MATIETPRTPAVAADVEGNVLTLTFANGKRLAVDANTLSDTIRTDAMMHGLKQKLVDAAAISRNLDTGRSATIDDKYDAVREVFDRITSPEGTWNKIRGDGVAATSGLLVRALMQLSGGSREDVLAKLEPMSAEEKTALRNVPKVAAIIASLKAAASKIDTDALLGKFDL